MYDKFISFIIIILKDNYDDFLFIDNVIYYDNT